MQVNVGKGITLDVDVTRLGFAPESELSPVALHVIYLGVRNPVMDSHAGITKESGVDYVAQSRAQATKKLESMYAGEVRAAGTREGDPVKAEAMRLAIKAVQAAIRKAGKKVSDYDTKALREKAATVVDKFMAQAEKNVAEAKAIEVDVEV